MPPMIDLAHLPYLQAFLFGLMLALGVGFLLFVRGQKFLPAERFCLLFGPVAAYLTLALAANKVIQTPDNDWNSARLAPAVGLWHGARIYVSPDGPGAVMNTIYPPMAYLVYLPAGFFRIPSFAIFTGSCISVALFFTPALLLCFSKRGEESLRPTMMGLVLILGLVQVAILSKAMHWAAFFIHADAPMYGFAAFACLTLYLNCREEILSMRTCLVSATCAILSIWSKQTAASLILMLPLWVLVIHGLRSAVRYTIWLVAATVIFTLLFVMIFGYHSLWFNIFSIPGRHGWTFQGPRLGEGLLLLSAEYFCVCSMFLAPFPLILAARAILTPSEVEGGEVGVVQTRGWRAVREWVQQNPWVLFAIVAFAAIPTSLLSRIKFGGFWNNLGPTAYFLSLGVIALLLEWYAENRRRGLLLFNANLTLVLLLLVLSPLSKCGEENFEIFKKVHPPMANRQEEAFRYASQHPGTAYFPFNPISSLFGEGKLYHHVFGLTDRVWAGSPISDEHFRLHIPENIKYVCIPSHETQNRYLLLMLRLPEFGKRVEIPELPGWICFER